ncbi:hypothetical protein NDU88_006536 [Pleurodeles waltl]|uniref:Secreted protein n=1 Tax=Pleurodeles waltl TaxID=8319 RepID=A0AAV7U0F5_PLEWA|nr:hypothetical protein NDU88_006536 [Pleurodeles waltl]
MVLWLRPHGALSAPVSRSAPAAGCGAERRVGGGWGRQGLEEWKSSGVPPPLLSLAAALGSVRSQYSREDVAPSSSRDA